MSAYDPKYADDNNSKEPCIDKNGYGKSVIKTTVIEYDLTSRLGGSHYLIDKAC